MPATRRVAPRPRQPWPSCPSSPCPAHANGWFVGKSLRIQFSEPMERGLHSSPCPAFATEWFVSEFVQIRSDVRCIYMMYVPWPVPWLPSPVPPPHSCHTQQPHPSNDTMCFIIVMSLCRNIQHDCNSLCLTIQICTRFVGFWRSYFS